MIEIDSYARPKKEGSGGGKTIINATVKGNALSDIKIWGADFDGVNDVDGDFTLTGGTMRVRGDAIFEAPFNGYANGSTGSWMMFDAHNFDENAELMHSKLILCNTDFELAGEQALHFDGVTIDKYGIDATTPYSIKSPQLTILSHGFGGYVDMGQSGYLMGGSIYTNNLYAYESGDIYIADNVIAGKDLTVQGNLNAKDLDVQNLTVEKEARMKDLTVTGNMTIFRLLIQEINSQAGTIVLSAGNFKVDAIGAEREINATTNYGVAGSGMVDQKYKVVSLYQISKRDNTEISNTCVVGDHVICYDANVPDKTTLNAKSYWTLVTSAAEKEIYLIGGESHQCNRIDIVTKVYANGEWRDPEWGPVSIATDDSLAVLGSSRRERQTAIVLASTNWIDLHIKAPALIIYENITGWTLVGKAVTYFSQSGNRISGDFIADSRGNSLDDLLEAIRAGQEMFMHKAYADSADGRDNFTKNPSNPEAYLYIGLCSNNNATDDELEYDNYIWTLNNSLTNKLVASRERLYLAADDCLYLDVEYLTQNLSSEGYSIKAEIQSYGRGKTTRDVNTLSYTKESVYYRGIVQSEWSQKEYDARYSTATIYLYDKSGNLLDSHTVQLVMEPGAVISVTDKINMRVTDADSNIASLEIRADQISSYVQDVSGNLSQVKQTATEISTRVSAVEADYVGKGTFSEFESSITQTAQGISTRVAAVEKDYVTGAVLQEATSEIKQTANSISTRVTAIENDYATGTQLRASVSSIEQTASSISSRVKTIEGDYITQSTLTQTASKLQSQITDNEHGISSLEQDINSISATVQGKASTGYVKLYVDDALSNFEVSADQINFKTGQFKITNQSGDTTFKVDSYGNITFAGTIQGGLINGDLDIGNGTNKMRIEPYGSSGARLAGYSGTYNTLFLGFYKYGGETCSRLNLSTKGGNNQDSVAWLMTGYAFADFVLESAGSTGSYKTIRIQTDANKGTYLHSYSWLTKDQASSGDTYVENGYLKVK